MTQVKHALFIQGASSFTAGILSILIPLLLLERNISIQNIGLIFAIYPIIFQLARISFGVVSDFFGRKSFYILNSVFGIITSIVYYFSYSIFGYSAAKFFEGMRDGSLWAVNRAFLLDQSNKDHHKQKNLVHLQTVAILFNAIGMFATGFLLTFLFFGNILIFCAIVGLITLPSALVLKDKLKTKISFSKLIDNLNLKKKSAVLKKFILLFCILGIVSGLTSDYIFPTFLKSNGFDVKLIGALLGLQLLLCGIFVFLFRRWKNIRKLIILSGLLTVIFLAPIGFANYNFIVIFILLLGIGSGISQVAMEIIVTKTTNKKSYGGDLGLLYLGFHITRSITLALSGFLIASLGFSIVFLIAAIIVMVYSIFAAIQFKRG